MQDQLRKLSMQSRVQRMRTMHLLHFLDMGAYINANKIGWEDLKHSFVLKKMKFYQNID